MAQVLSCARAGNGWLIRVKRGSTVEVVQSDREHQPGTSVSMVKDGSRWRVT